jgi:hypothetical protein
LLKFKRLERDVLGGDQELAGESAFRGPAPQRFFGGEKYEIGIVVFLGDVRENQITRDGVEPVRVR